MTNRLEEVCNTVLARLKPKESERAKIEALTKKLEKQVAGASKALGVESVVRVEGSVAKDTWLSGEPDIDVFMRVASTIPRKDLGEIGLKIARKATKGARQIERFAEHPYLEAFVDDIRVNIVPCYDVKNREWLSATDRTPFHTDYVKAHLNVKMRNEVRLLKRFMAGIGVYGAEIKIGGFSGYLCELLILQYKSFVRVLEAFAQHKRRILIDIENCYRGRENELEFLFKEPLVIVDPVDKGRNVASAVQAHKFYTFAAAAQAFLRNSGLDFFYPPETAALTTKELRQQLERRGSVMLFLVFGEVNAVPDVLWGQLYKSQRSLDRLLQLNDFHVLRSLSWSNEANLNMFVFELEQCVLSPVEKHLGPPIEKEEECEKFLAKHLDNPDTVSGPFIENGRWVVERCRKCIDAVALLSSKLKDGGKNAGISSQIARRIRMKLRILVNGKVTQVYERNDDFAKFLTEFLSGKPKWLEPT